MLRLVFRGLLLMTLLVLVAWFMRDVLDTGWVDRTLRDRGGEGMLLFVLVCALLGSVGLSRQVVAFLGGYAFGFNSGFLLSMLAVVAACLLTYGVARLLLRGVLAGRLPERVQRVERFLQQNTFGMSVLLRLLPLGSNWLINIAAGGAGVRPLPFLSGSALGYIPQMIIFALLGSGTRVSQFGQVAIAMALFVAASAIGVALYRQVRQHDRQLAGEQQAPYPRSDSASPARK